MAFKKAGIRVLAAPRIIALSRPRLTFTNFLPDTWRLECSRSALHQYVGILYYLLTSSLSLSDSGIRVKSSYLISASERPSYSMGD